MMSFLGMPMDIIWTRSSLIHIVMLIHILDIFDQAMLLHVLNKAWLSICDCLRIISNWNCSKRLSNCCVFNFQTCRQPLRCPVRCRRIQHLNSTSKFFNFPPSPMPPYLFWFIILLMKSVASYYEPFTFV